MRRYFLGACLLGSLSVANSALAEDTASSRTPRLVDVALPEVPASSKRSHLEYSDAASASYAAGGALVRTGITLFVLAPSPDEQVNHSLRVAARVARSGGCLQLEGVW